MSYPTPCQCEFIPVSGRGERKRKHLHVDFKLLGSLSVKEHKADICNRMGASTQKIIYNGMLKQM